MVKIEHFNSITIIKWQPLPALAEEDKFNYSIMRKVSLHQNQNLMHMSENLNYTTYKKLN